MAMVLLLPTEMKAVDYYLGTSTGGGWTMASEKFQEVDGKYEIIVTIPDANDFLFCIFKTNSVSWGEAIRPNDNIYGTSGTGFATSGDNVWHPDVYNSFASALKFVYDPTGNTWSLTRLVDLRSKGNGNFGTPTYLESPSNDEKYSGDVTFSTGDECKVIARSVSDNKATNKWYGGAYDALSITDSNITAPGVGTYNVNVDFSGSQKKIVFTAAAPATKFFINYGGTDYESTSNASPYTFKIPQRAFVDGTGLSFTIKDSDGKTYNPDMNTALTNGATGTYTATGKASWTCAEKANAKGYTVTLNTRAQTVALTYSTTTVTPPTPVTGENYYLIGDWNNWEVDKTFKFQPVMGEPGKYMLYINAPVNMKNSSGEEYINENNTNEAGGYVLRFIIAPEDALSGTEVTWGNCYCPETNNPTINITGSAQTTGIAKKYDSSKNAWKLQRNNVDLISGVNNGGSYRFILDMSDSSNPKWEITSTPNTRVLYFLKESDNYLFDGNYLIDLVGTTKIYNQNFEGIVSMEKGEYYKLSDGYHIYKSKGNDENENGNANRGYGEIKYQEVGFDYTADERVIFPYESGSYVAKANVLNWNDLNMWKKDGPANKIEWRAYSSGGTTQLSVSYSVAGGKEKPMTFDAENKVWYASCVEIGNSEDVNFTEKHDSDIAAAPTEKNDPNGEGTYKLIYVDTQTTADGKPVDKLLLSNDLGKITNEGVFIRTFSDYYARLIPEGLTAYYATGYDATNKIVNLTSIKDGIIPANTGVVLIYDGNTEGINFDPVMTPDVQTAETVSLEKADAEGTAPRNNGTEPYGYGETNNGEGMNWLVTDLKHDTPSAGPVTRNGNNVITYRNYYLANMDLDGNGSKTLGFYRVKAEAAAVNPKNVRKAYLAMPASVQTDGSNDELQDNTSATPVTAAKRVTMIFDGDIIGGTPTGITDVNVNADVVSKDNSFYNLQGIKVSKPSKGIYIYQGKKIVIK